MPHSEPEIACLWVQDRIDLYLDADLPPQEKSLILAHTNQCIGCAAELELAARVVGSLRALPLLPCPQPVSDAVRQEIAALRPSWRPSWSRRSWRPVLVGLAASVLLALTALVGHEPKPASRVNSEELAVAENQARWALAYLARINRRTDLVIRQAILNQRALAPLRRTIQKTFKNQSLSQIQEADYAG